VFEKELSRYWDQQDWRRIQENLERQRD